MVTEPDEARIAIESKLRYMEEHIAKLRRYLPGELADYLKSDMTRSAVERQCQLVVECATDINCLLLAWEDRPPPRFAAEGHTEARDLGAIDEYLEGRFRHTYIGLRNRLVHDYERLDDDIVYRTARRLLEDGDTYVRSILAYLDRAVT